MLCCGLYTQYQCCLYTQNPVLYRPRNDTCKQCDSLNVQIKATEEQSDKQLLQSQLQLHHCKAQRAYQQLSEDTALCQSAANVDMITFDLQQSLPTPKLSTNIVFYKRQLWTYNLGVHDCLDGKGYMFIWPENVASRGSQEVCSSIMKFLQSRANHLIAFSDSCGGQNRNINVICFWAHVVSSPELSYNTIDHQYMMLGHSYLPNDRDFGSIEKASRRSPHIFVPDDWATLVEKARGKNPFKVTNMAMSDFVSVQAIRSEIVYRKINTKKEKVEWFNIRWLQLQKDNPLMIRYRYSYNTLEVWKVLDLRKRRVGRPVDIGRLHLTPLYSSPRPINAKKLEDLNTLMQFIPPVHHAFYTGLESTSGTPKEETDTEQ